MTASERADLQRWMIRLADGDRSALEPVYLRVEPLVRGLALRMLGSPADAEDVVLSVFSHAAEFDRRRDPVAWVLGITA